MVDPEHVRNRVLFNSTKERVHYGETEVLYERVQAQGGGG
jgi:hypothetical protein